ncbi:MAG: HAD-IIB family hydrolase [Pseudomonadota bacterium]
MNCHPAFIVFTDLDGTLLDHDDYSWAPARDALARLRDHAIPLIAVSSKTLAELCALNDRDSLFDGLIGENGGVIALGNIVMQPGSATATIDQARNAISQALDIPVAGFRTSTPQQIATATGLDLTNATLAGQRHCSDPLIWQPSEYHIQTASDIARQHGLQLVRGGRFHTLCGTADKALAMQIVLTHLKDKGRMTANDGPVTVIALGDSPNDASMLRAADIAVQIPPKRGVPPILDLGGKPALLAPHPGPHGWNHMIHHILDHQISDITAR